MIVTGSAFDKLHKYHLTYIILYYDKEQSIRHHQNSHHAVFVKIGHIYVAFIPKKSLDIIKTIFKFKFFRIYVLWMYFKQVK